MHRAHRFLRHAVHDHLSVRRAFAPAALAQIEQAIAEGERIHRGQVCFAVEGGLPLLRVFRRLTPRERALEVFGLLRVWDTEENAGVLIYLLLADRDVEIVADRGIDRRVDGEEWRAICARMETMFGDGALRRRRGAGHRRNLRAARAAFPAHDRRPPNELARPAGHPLTPASAIAAYGAVARVVDADQVHRVVLALVQAMAPHDHQHQRRHRQAEHDDRGGHRQARAHHQRRTGPTITRMPMFSLKFCTAIECPAPISTWPRCCKSAFIGTTKNPAQAPMPTISSIASGM